jgi:cyclophilin family peptidyl-prolyl cis-trans isomerase
MSYSPYIDSISAGEVVPKTVENFKQLCSNSGYRGSPIFRIISTFSVQAGALNIPPNTPASGMQKYGQSAINSHQGFPPENFRILHDYKDAGVVSMMKDVRSGMQDSRFFVTTSSSAAWADGKYSAFGRVTKGEDAIKALQILEVQPPSNFPLTKVSILDSGLLDISGTDS